jgi:putative membrane protein
MKTAIFAAALLLALSSIGAYSQPTGVSTKPDGKAQGTKGALSGDDRAFMMKAAADGMAEVELGKMAKEKAASSQVKDFAARMVTDHSKANDELKSLAGSKGVSLPSAPDKDQKAHSEKMAKLSGPGFDKGYIDHMVADHKKAVDLFTKTSRSARDPDVKAFASRTLPTLQDHLKMAQSAAATVKGGPSESADKKAASEPGKK